MAINGEVCAECRTTKHVGGDSSEREEGISCLPDMRSGNGSIILFPCLETVFT